MAAFEMTRIDLRNQTLSTAQLRAALPRGGVDVDAVVPTVRPIVEDIAQRGATAALEYGESFDGVRPKTVRVPTAALHRALEGIERHIELVVEARLPEKRAGVACRWCPLRTTCDEGRAFLSDEADRA